MGELAHSIKSFQTFGCHCISHCVCPLPNLMNFRDYSPKLKQKGLLFSICSPEDVKLVDDGEKSNNYAQHLEEAEVIHFHFFNLSISSEQSVQSSLHGSTAT